MSDQNGLWNPSWALSPPEFIRRLFTAVLRRPVDPNGGGHWTHVVESTGDPTLALVGLMSSGEYERLPGVSRQITLPNGVSFFIEVHVRDDLYISQMIVRDGIWEPLETAIFCRLFASDVEFFDIGANIGWYSLIASRMLLDRGRAHAFEPSMDNAALLARNLARNGAFNVNIVPCALGEIVGSGLLYKSAVNAGDHRTFPGSEYRASDRIGLLRFDHYFDRAVTRPLVIKIDAQGAELDILLGTGDVLSSHPHECVLVIELWPYGLNERGHSAEELIAYLETHRFSCLALSEIDDSLVRVSWDEVRRACTQEFSVESGHGTNLVLFREGSVLIESITDLITTGSSIAA